MKQNKILWADDEIDLLKPHILFLQEKGYNVIPTNSGQDALDLIQEEVFDLVFLDENMPGLSGLETLSLIKERNPNIPVIMITKSEDEGIMTHAIGKKIADYLIKPVNPNQILLSIKKNLHKDDIVSEVTLEGYRGEFNKISSLINFAQSIEDWMEVYQKIVFWEMELMASQSPLIDMLISQKTEANSEFSKFIKRNYEKWMDSDFEGRPLLSPDLMKKKVLPLLDEGEKIFFIVIDNFRLDQWNEIKELLSNDFSFDEDLYCSILPTATQYARNSIFSGLMPLKIAEMYPHLWVEEDEEEGKNMNEEELIQTLLDRYRKKYSFSYNKVITSSYGDKVVQNINALASNDLNVIVLNFVDMLSHARTDSQMIRELAGDEAAYRSLTKSWFRHSSTIDLFKAIAQKGAKIVLTTDHGTIRVQNPLKIVGDRNTNTNLRYKLGKNLNYDHKKVYEVKHPASFGLPSPNLSTTYIFATNNDFFAYPNNYSHYAPYYSDTFQHGGISMEEMIVPIVTLTPKQ